MESIFPFVTRRPYKLHKAFLRVKPEGMHWHEIDVKITSPVSAEFRVYDMADGVHGGRGRLIATLEGGLAPEEAEPFIQQRIRDMAVEIEEDEFDLRRQARRDEIVRELTAALESSRIATDGVRE